MWNWAIEKGYAPSWLWKAAPLCLFTAVTLSLPTLLGQGYRPFMPVASVKGTLTHLAITKCGSYKGNTTWTPEVSYQYTVGPTSHTGSKFAIERACDSREAVERATKHLAPGQAVTVFYNRENPRFAMLEKPGSLLWKYLAQTCMYLVGITILWNHYRIRCDR